MSGRGRPVFDSDAVLAGGQRGGVHAVYHSHVGEMYVHTGLGKAASMGADSSILGPPYPKDAGMNLVLQTTVSRTVVDAPKKGRRRSLDQMTGQDAAAQRSIAARVLAENPADRLAVAGFNSSI